MHCPTTPPGPTPPPTEGSVTPPLGARDPSGGPVLAWSSLPTVAPTSVPAALDALKARPNTGLAFDPTHTKANKSGLRWAIYSRATTYAHFLALHHDACVLHGLTHSAREDLKYDLLHGLARLAPAPRAVRRLHPSCAPPTPPTPLMRTAQSYADEAATLHLIEAYEPAPPPGHPLLIDGHPDYTGDPRTHTTAYETGMRILRLAYSDEPAPPPDDFPPPHPDPAAHLPPSIILSAAALDPAAPTAPTSVAAARRLKDFHAPHGWHDAITKHLSIIEGFNAWHVVPMSSYHQARREVGPARVSAGNLVAIFVCKLDPAGDPRDPTIVNKFRIAISDPSDAASGVPTFSSCVAPVTNRLITAIAPAIGAEQTSIDVSSAYYHGTPDPITAGGRYLFARIPTWLTELFPDKYPSHDPLGRPNILRIPGNMPGRCDAGRIWQRELDTFLRDYGLRQLLTDRRVWVLNNHLGSLIVHDHVDDSRLTYTTQAACDAFHSAWAIRFNQKMEGTPISEDFTGLRHHRLDDYTISISCEGVIRRLEKTLKPFPILPNEHCDWPLTTRAFHRLRDRLRTRPTTTDSTDPLVPHLVHAAQALLGSEGFITGLVRADGFFAYSVLSRLAQPETLTHSTFRCIVLLGHYLVTTKHLALHITPPPLTIVDGGGTGLDLFSTYVDASNGNWLDGCGFGGIVLATNRDPLADPAAYGGGALAWGCVAPRAGDDSSGAAELRLASMAYKHTLAARFIQAELGVGVAPTKPTPLYLDATVVLDGFECERITRDSRWMAMRYAMIRWGKACATIDPRKLPTEDNPADGNTKCLTGPAFVTTRNRLLGYPAT